MAQLAVCQIYFWLLIGAGEYNCWWFFCLVFTTVFSFRFSSSFLSSNVSFLRYYFASALDTSVRHRDCLDCQGDMNGILRYFCLDHGCVVLLTTLYYLFYMFKVLLVYSFVFHPICYCCLLILTVLCFSGCCLLTCPLCCCFLCGSSAIGTKYPL